MIREYVQASGKTYPAFNTTLQEITTSSVATQVDTEATQRDINAKKTNVAENKAEIAERKKRIEVAREAFLPQLEQAKQEHPELIPKPEELQKAKTTLQNSDWRSNLQSNGLSEDVLNDYLSGYIYQANAKQQGVQVSSEFSSTFKDFQSSLNLPDRLLAQIEIQADIPTTSISSFTNNPEAVRMLFDPETGSQSLKSSYDKSREQKSEIYDEIDEEMDTQELVSQYGNGKEQALFQQISTLLATIQSRSSKQPTAAEQQQFNQRNQERQQVRQQLLRKKAECEKGVKEAMGRTLISGQAMQHCKRLNSVFGGDAVFNPANAFKMEGATLTTTVRSAEGRYPFRIRTDASKPGNIQISQFLSPSTPTDTNGNVPKDAAITLGDEGSFVNINYLAPTEDELLNTMLSTYTSVMQPLSKGNLSPDQRYKQVQKTFQDAIENSYVNTPYIQDQIQQKMQVNIATQQRLTDRKSIMPEGEGEIFNKKKLIKTADSVDMRAKIDVFSDFISAIA